MNYTGQQYPACPLCDHQHQDWHDLDLEEGVWQQIDCENCGKSFEINMDRPMPSFDSRT